MTLIEAIKSGKRFRRPNNANWNEPELSYRLYIYQDDAIATDWEVEPNPIPSMPPRYSKRAEELAELWTIRHLPDYQSVAKSSFLEGWYACEHEPKPPTQAVTITRKELFSVWRCAIRNAHRSDFAFNQTARELGLVE